MSQEQPKTSRLKTLMKSLDYFAVTFDFRIDGKQKYGSVTGGTWFL